MRRLSGGGTGHEAAHALKYRFLRVIVGVRIVLDVGHGLRKLTRGDGIDGFAVVSRCAIGLLGVRVAGNRIDDLAGSLTWS